MEREITTSSDLAAGADTWVKQTAHVQSPSRGHLQGAPGHAHFTAVLHMQWAILSKGTSDFWGAPLDTLKGLDFPKVLSIHPLKNQGPLKVTLSEAPPKRRHLESHQPLLKILACVSLFSPV